MTTNRVSNSHQKGILTNFDIKGFVGEVGPDQTETEGIEQEKKVLREIEERLRKEQQRKESEEKK